MLQISGWISRIFVIVSLYHGFGTNRDEILAKPSGMQDLINAAFWQTSGYRKSFFEKYRLHLLTMGSFQRRLLHSLRSRSGPTLQNLAILQRQDARLPEPDHERQRYLADALRHSVRRVRFRQVYSGQGQLESDSERQVLE